MSAFIVSTSTIEAIVTFAVRHLDSIEPLPGSSTAAWVPIRVVPHLMESRGIPKSAGV